MQEAQIQQGAHPSATYRIKRLWLQNPGMLRSLTALLLLETLVEACGEAPSFSFKNNTSELEGSQNGAPGPAYFNRFLRIKDRLKEALPKSTQVQGQTSLEDATALDRSQLDRFQLPDPGGRKGDNITPR